MFALYRSFSPRYTLRFFRLSPMRSPYFLSSKETTEPEETPVYDDEYMNPFVFDW